MDLSHAVATLAERGRVNGKQQTEARHVVGRSMDTFDLEWILQEVRNSRATDQRDVARVITRALDELGYDLRRAPSLEEMKELLMLAILHSRPNRPPRGVKAA
jgi:hypothetical protein